MAARRTHSTLPFAIPLRRRAPITSKTLRISTQIWILFSRHFGFCTRNAFWDRVGVSEIDLGSIFGRADGSSDFGAPPPAAGPSSRSPLVCNTCANAPGVFLFSAVSRRELWSRIPCNKGAAEGILRRECIKFMLCCRCSQRKGHNGMLRERAEERNLKIYQHQWPQTQQQPFCCISCPRADRFIAK